METAEQLVRYCIDELAWPLEEEEVLESSDIEELMFEWNLAELGIQPGTSRRIERVRQMRPLTANQPWGIFFVELAGPRLLVTQIRQLLDRLVTKRRASRHANRRRWALDDLIFLVTTDQDPSEMHLLVFFKGQDKVEFRCVSWRPTDPTRRLRRLSDELLPHLTWPNDEQDVDAWRKEWREPFTLRLGEVIASAARLADRMARTARDLRNQIKKALADEEGKGPFSGLMSEIREQLVAEVDEEQFSDMCAQTLVYGLLSSRVTDPDGFGATPVLSIVPLSNPFLSAFFDQVHGEASGLDLEGSGLEQLAADLRETNVEAILDDFGSTAKGGDPVIHFYEEFLKQYDRKMRADAGAFYTPEPVVAFIVRGVDELLRSRFGLKAGIADSATWQQVADNVGFEVPESIDPNKPFISMVDPATGTGTFLIHWLRQAKRSFTTANPNQNWQEHLSTVVLPAIHAFEFMLGPYTVAHLKLALHLHDEGGLPPDSETILLTDTLDHEPPQPKLDVMEDPVAAEGRVAARLKKTERFTVVIGNPPYDREQRTVGDTGKRKGGVVRYGAAGLKPLLNDVTGPLKDAGLGNLAPSVHNLYVYFWRWAVWQATQLPPGPGIVAFITASSYLEGLSMGGVRSLLREAFDELRIIDLGGEGRGALTEENVFDIQTPVAIAFGVRTGSPGSSCTVRYLRATGTRQQKYEQLAALSLQDVTTDIPGKGLDRFVPYSSDAIYWSWPRVTDIFPWSHSGSKFHRTWPIGETKALLQRRWNDLVTAVPRSRAELFFEKEMKVASTPTPLLTRGKRLRPIRLCWRSLKVPTLDH
ncbi:MAG: hypothetical protein OXS33_01000 [bacterium]|nr:hypothetical protein [bacterium]